jgi:hypothetical protein
LPVSNFEGGQREVTWPAFRQRDSPMKVSTIALAVVLFAIGVRAQDRAPIQPPPAAISCSAHVPADTCKWVTSVFTVHQLSSSMREVEIVIDDKQAFLQESERLQTKFANAMLADPGHREKARASLSSPYDDSLLFELGEEAYVARVVVSIELFSKIKFVPDANGVQYAVSTGELDRESVSSWAFYITGYVEGSRRSRLHSAAEYSEEMSER